MLCLDDAKIMQPKVKGERVALVTPLYPEGGILYTVPLVIPVYLSGSKAGPLQFLLDSGAEGGFLYDPEKYLTPASLVSEPLRSRSIDGAERTFAVLPPQNMKVGAVVCCRLAFATLIQNDRSTPKIPVDGMVPTALFRRVYISYFDRFVILEPW